MNNYKCLNYLLFALIAFSCNNTSVQSNKSNTNIVEQNETDTILTNKRIQDSNVIVDNHKQINDEIIYKASGSEPGWYMELTTTQVRFINNYGQDTMIFEHKKDIEKLPLLITKEDISIKIDKQKCTAVSGEEKLLLVEINYKGKTLRGCGDKIKRNENH